MSSHDKQGGKPVDLRDLGHRRFEVVFEKLGEIGDGEALTLINDREPHRLLEALAEEGHSYETSEKEDGSWIITVVKGRGVQKAAAPPTLVSTPTPTEARPVALNATSISIPMRSFFYTPYFVALDRGFFREEGLEVILRTAGGAERAVRMLEGGEVDFCAARGDTVREALKGKPLKQVAGCFGYPPHRLITRPEIKTLADLKGRRVGVTYVGSTPYLQLKYALIQFGIDPERDVSFAEAPPGYPMRSLLEALVEGKIDGAVITPPESVLAVRRGFNQLLKIGDVLKDWPLTGLATTTKMISERRGVVEKVVRALSRGVEFARGEKELTIEILRRRVTTLDRESAELVYDELSDAFTIDLTLEGMRREVEVTAKVLGLKETPPPEELVDLSFVEDVLKYRGKHDS